MVSGAIDHCLKKHVYNEEVRRKIQAAIGEYDELWSRNGNKDGLPTS